MFWFFVPLLIVVLIAVIAVAIIGINIYLRGGDGVPTPGQTVYDRDEQKSKRHAPPA